MIESKRRYNRKPKQVNKREVILALLKKNNMTQLELADKSGVNYKTLNWIINNADKSLNLSTALAIAEVFGVSVETLF